MRRTATAVAAAVLAGTALPVPSASAAQDFGGFVANATATPLTLEVYEPTIPIPAEPQAELDFAYTKTETSTGPVGKGVASWLWPGDNIGQGFKTFVELLGLPPQVGENGYPVQVNSETPGGPEADSDEPVPGSVMRTRSSPAETVAEVGWSPDGDVSRDSSDGGGEAPSAPTVPGLPAGNSLGTTTSGTEGSSPDLPTPLAAIVDVGGMTSVSRSLSSGDTIRSVSTSTLSDLSLLGGAITADAVKVSTTTTSDGSQGRTSTVSRVVGLELAGTPITVDRDGVTARGQSIPGLPDDPGRALARLGVSFELPRGHRQATGSGSSADLRGLQIVIDTRPLRSNLDSLPLDVIVNALPDETGELKSALGAAVHLSPKFVVTAGKASSEATTVPMIDLPSVDAGSLTGAGGVGAGSTTSTGGVGTDVGPDAGAAVPPPMDAAAASGQPTGVATRNAAAGLPPLASVPGALMVAGFMIASGVGWWLQRIGALVLGGAGSCAHGLETGLPDLRKA